MYGDCVNHYELESAVSSVRDDLLYECDKLRQDIYQLERDLQSIRYNISAIQQSLDNPQTPEY